MTTKNLGGIDLNAPLTLAGSAGTSGQVLTSAGTAATPTWGSVLTANSPLLTRVDSTNEGGQINFARASDGTARWYLDVFGSTTTPNFRVVEDTTVRAEFQAGGNIVIAGAVTVGSVIKSGAASTDYLMGDGTTSSLIAKYVPNLISGTNVYVPTVSGTATSGAMGLGFMPLIPVYITKTVTADRISVNVTSASGAGVLRLGIYNSDANYQPSSLLLDAGTVSSTSTGVKEITISQSLSPGVYWLAAVAQTSTCNITSYSAVANPLIMSTSFQTGNQVAYQVGSVTGALPSTASGFTVTQSNPAIRLRVT